MAFLVTVLCYLLIPGILIRYIWPRPGAGFIFIPAWSWIYLTLVFLVSRLISSEVVVVTIAVHGGLVLLAGGAAAKWARRRHSPVISLRGDTIAGGVVVVMVYSVYFLWAGPYMEIPADVYHHMAVLQAALEPMDDGNLIQPNGSAALLTQAARHWYVIFAYFALQSGTAIEEAYPYIAYVNAVFLLVGIYVLALYVFKPIRESRWTKIAIALATVLFFCLHFGVNVFSYIRYYAIAPTITAYLIYASAIIVVAKLYEGTIRKTDAAIYVTACIAATGLLHVQEMIFILVMTWTMGAVCVFQAWSDRSAAVRSAGQGGGELDWRRIARNPAWIITIAGLVVFGTSAVLSHVLMERANISRPWIAPLSDFLPFVKHLYVLNPNYQFFHVMAVWGYLVYILFIVLMKRLRNNIFLLAGMAVPFVTVLNPAFVDVYLRYEGQTTLWRMMYMVPFAFAGGYFLVLFLKAGLEGGGGLKRTGNLLMVGLLLATLLPFDVLYAENRYSRIYTLLETSAENGPERWGDLLAVLDDQKRSYVLTDPVTGYVINALTKHKVNTYKFHRLDAIDLDKDHYTEEDFEIYAGKLLVINTREGVESRVGRLSGHWPAGILHTKRHYSEEFFRFVERHGDVFPLVWRSDGIAVHRVRDT